MKKMLLLLSLIFLAVPLVSGESYTERNWTVTYLNEQKEEINTTTCFNIICTLYLSVNNNFKIIRDATPTIVLPINPSIATYSIWENTSHCTLPIYAIRNTSNGTEQYQNGTTNGCYYFDYEQTNKFDFFYKGKTRQRSKLLNFGKYETKYFKVTYPNLFSSTKIKFDICVVNSSNTTELCLDPFVNSTQNVLENFTAGFAGANSDLNFSDSRAGFDSYITHAREFEQPFANNSRADCILHYHFDNNQTGNVTDGCSPAYQLTAEGSLIFFETGKQGFNSQIALGEAGVGNTRIGYVTKSASDRSALAAINHSFTVVMQLQGNASDIGLGCGQVQLLGFDGGTAGGAAWSIFANGTSSSWDSIGFRFRATNSSGGVTNRDYTINYSFVTGQNYTGIFIYDKGNMQSIVQLYGNGSLLATTNGSLPGGLGHTLSAGNVSANFTIGSESFVGDPTHCRFLGKIDEVIMVNGSTSVFMPNSTYLNTSWVRTLNFTTNSTIRLMRVNFSIARNTSNTSSAINLSADCQNFQNNVSFNTDISMTSVGTCAMAQFALFGTPSQAAEVDNWQLLIFYGSAPIFNNGTPIETNTGVILTTPALGNNLSIQTNITDTDNDTINLSINLTAPGGALVHRNNNVSIQVNVSARINFTSFIANESGGWNVTLSARDGNNTATNSFLFNVTINNTAVTINNNGSVNSTGGFSDYIPQGDRMYLYTNESEPDGDPINITFFVRDPAGSIVLNQTITTGITSNRSVNSSAFTASRVGIYNASINISQSNFTNTSNFNITIFSVGKSNIVNMSLDFTTSYLDNETIFRIQAVADVPQEWDYINITVTLPNGTVGFNATFNNSNSSKGNVSYDSVLQGYVSEWNTTPYRVLANGTYTLNATGRNNGTIASRLFNATFRRSFTFSPESHSKSYNTKGELSNFTLALINNDQTAVYNISWVCGNVSNINCTPNASGTALVDGRYNTSSPYNVFLNITTPNNNPNGTYRTTFNVTLYTRDGVFQTWVNNITYYDFPPAPELRFLNESNNLCDGDNCRNFPTIPSDSLTTITFRVRNDGNETATNANLTLTGDFSGKTFWSFDDSLFSLAQFENRTITLTITRPAVGRYTGSVIAEFLDAQLNRIESSSSVSPYIQLDSTAISTPPASISSASGSLGGSTPERKEEKKEEASLKEEIRKVVQDPFAFFKTPFGQLVFGAGMLLFIGLVAGREEKKKKRRGV